jgi:hypothetical protein
VALVFEFFNLVVSVVVGCGLIVSSVLLQFFLLLDVLGWCGALVYTASGVGGGFMSRVLVVKNWFGSCYIEGVA